MMRLQKYLALSGVASRLGNVLEQVTAAQHSEIRVIEELIRKNGVQDTIMTGSGPTVFGIFEDRTAAEVAGMQLFERFPQTFVTTFR